MPALATAGSSRTDPDGLTPSLGRRLRGPISLLAKAGLLAVIFLFVPVILYGQFRAADQQKRDMMMASVRSQGELIATMLAPALAQDDQPNLPAIGLTVAGLANKLTTIKLLFRPAGTQAGFFYVGSSAPLSNDTLDAERARLKDEGVLDRLEDSCSGAEPIQTHYTAPDGHDEVVLSVVPLRTANGCWAVVSSLSAASMLGVPIDVPYYDTPEVKVAGVIYLLMAMLTLTTFWSIWRGLLRFGERARAIGRRPAAGESFKARNEVPELAGIAEEFDRMVETLQNTARDLRRTAEDNAHAFKTPVAIIRQSLEPVARAVPSENARAVRALGLIEQSLDKLDGLVASARRLDEATAALLDQPRSDIDLSGLLARVLAAHAELFRQHEVQVRRAIADGIVVRGNEEMIEIVVENVIENAMSFAGSGSTIRVTLEAFRDMAELAIADEGPGVPEGDLPRIFERYTSAREAMGEPEEHAVHYGVGLSIVRRNVEALGGRVWAENLAPRGLAIRIHLPLKRRGDAQ